MYFKKVILFFYRSDAVALNCLTLVGIVGEELSIRQFDV